MPLELELSQSQEPDEIPYAIAKLVEVARLVTKAIAELPVLRAKLEKLMATKSIKSEDIRKTLCRNLAAEMQHLRNKLADTVQSARLPFCEADMPEMAAMSGKLAASLKAFNLMTPDYTKLCTILQTYLSKFPIQPGDDKSSGNVNGDNRHKASAAVIARLMNNVRMGYYPTDLTHIQHITRSISFPIGVTTNLFDPCCGCGLALRAMAQGNNCYAYGVELDEHRAEEAQSRLHRVGFGSYFHSHISHEAFHAMLLNPPYLNVITPGGGYARSEKRFLVDSIWHLMIGGLLVYIIPYYRLTSDICRVLCDNFTDISVWRFADDEFAKWKQIAVMGIRKKRDRWGFSPVCADTSGTDNDAEQQAAALSAQAEDIASIPLLDTIPDGRYPLPDTPKKMDLFKGAQFNINELADQLKQSKSFSKLFESKKLDTLNKRPLLPLNLGQIGLVGGSGLINGLVECDIPHIIKGRIIKEKRESTEDVTRGADGAIISATIRETVTNKMIFNVLTAAGFQSLL